VSRVDFSVAMIGAVDAAARAHLLRTDGQEDLCFALWRPSQGRSRQTALLQRLILPGPGDRNVHGNVSFNADYLERVLGEAAVAGCGIALMHSHPGGHGWQGMSPDDITAEQGRAAAALGATGLPLVGLTLASDGTWSARFWPRTAPRTYERRFCGTVRVIGDRLGVHYFDELVPPPAPTAEQIRTVSSWGSARQANLARLRVGVVGAGSVGGLVAEALGRTGFEDVMLIDFDEVETHNLDRLVYATRADIGRPKIEVLAEHLKARATAAPFRAEEIPAAVYETDGFRAALDCDMLFACVDRPWGRYILNVIAYAHLIPVIDGGIAVTTNPRGELLRADWRAHAAAPGRRCLCCLGQYSPGFVQTEREGLLDDPTYIAGLPAGHALKMRENVFAFSMSCASFQVLQMLALAVAPQGIGDPGPQLYHFVGGFLEDLGDARSCDPACPYPGLGRARKAVTAGCVHRVASQPEAAARLVAAETASSAMALETIGTSASWWADRAA
jgi:molybdopterin-synthase adenylyltransferase